MSGCTYFVLRGERRWFKRMTLEEVITKYDISYDMLEKYVSFGFIDKLKKENGSYEYVSENFKNLGLIDTLLNAGFLFDEVKKYLNLIKTTGTDNEQIYLLKKQRRNLLNDIHRKQKLLDNLDFIIWKIKKKQEG